MSQTWETGVSALIPGSAQFLQIAKLLIYIGPSGRKREFLHRNRDHPDKEEAFAKRKAAIEAQFSRWDGSHPSVEKMVKRGMKNPDSYQHVETKYAIKPSGFVVVTTIRGTNSFGGIVPQTFRAILDDSGNVLPLTNAD